jgi:hypothetical protein
MNQMTMTLKRLEPILERVGVKERAKIEKHLAVCDAEAAALHGKLWRRVVSILGELAPLSMQSVGNNTWRFFVADGKYRMQVFALEDAFDGTLKIYMPDIINDAVKSKILTKTSTPQTYAANGSETKLKIESLGATEAAEAPPHYKHMLGWNRKALRVSLSTVDADDALDNAVQAMAAIAAKKWVANEPVASAKK